MVGKRIASIFSICLLAVAPAAAQVSGSLSGAVVDQSGAPVPNAIVGLSIAGGQQALVSTKTSGAGLFSFIALRPDLYDVTVEMTGFAKVIQRQVKVDPIRTTGVGEIKLEVASSQQLVEVTADVQQVQLTNAELSTTVTREQIQNLPVLGRQVSNLFLTQAGVSSGRGPTVINGLRTSLANVTLDGVNIQDNFIRTNALDYMPFRPTIDQISEMTVAVGNAASTIGGGAAQIVLSTRSGSNEYHGAAYWYNRNNKFSANDWFNNRAGVAKPFLNLNQVGGALGGKIVRDKLFFYANYEVYRLKQQSSVLRTVLTPEAKRGTLNYLTTGGTRTTANLLNSRNVRVDPTIQSFIDQLPPPNTTETGDGFNTSGYRFNARGNNNRDQFVTRWDYYKSSNHNITGTFNYTKEVTERPTLGNFYSAVPPVSNENPGKLVALAWRWTLSPQLTNEVRGGFALAPGIFNVSNAYPEFLVTVPTTIFSTPQNRFLRQGRDTDTYTIQDNAQWIKGRHELSFGFQSQAIRTTPFNDGGILTDYTTGISAANTTGFTAADLPGVRAQDITFANNLYSTLGGIVTSATRSFNVTSRTSGFVAGAPERREFTYDTYAGYLQDRWKVNKRLSLTLGLRYEYWTRLNEKNGLFLLPRLTGGNAIATLLDPNATIDYAGGDTGRPFYNADRNNFAPNIGIAWDPTGGGRTSVRAGYSISYGNDDSITAIRNNIGTNNGLAQTNQILRQTATLAAKLPVPSPTFKVPLTLADNYALNAGAAAGLPDPGMRTPYVQQWSLGVQHQIKANIVELRYVGNHGTKLIRALDYNQVVIRENGFLDDFRRAQSNGFLSLAVGRGFNPAYNAAISGSQQLTVFPRLTLGGLLDNATVQQQIRQGEVGSLGELYQTNGLNDQVNFFRNPNILGANIITNGGDSTYHALQFDFRRQMSKGLNFQANYSFSKVLSNAIGDDQNRFEPYLDLGSPEVERARAPFDLTHVIKANGFYELPVGKGKRFEMTGVADKVLGGWLVGGIMNYTSGTPFSIFSNRGTLNRGGRSIGRNTAIALANKSQLDQQVGRLVMTGNGPFFVNTSALGADNRGVSSDGSAAFNGQLFYNPGAGALGTLQRRMFSGPWNFSLDTSVLKTFRFMERHSVEFRAEAFNLLNNPSFWVGSETDATTRFDINQTTFGRVTATFNSRRLLQFGLYYRF